MTDRTASDDARCLRVSWVSPRERRAGHRDDGYGDEHDDFGAGDPNTGRGPFTAERERISSSELDAEIGECIAEEVGELVDAGGGSQVVIDGLDGDWL